MYLATANNGLIGGLILAWAIFFLGTSVGLVIWGLALFHVIRHSDIANRWWWLVVVLFIPILGAMVYFLVVLLPYNREHPYTPPDKSAHT